MSSCESEQLAVSQPALCSPSKAKGLKKSSSLPVEVVEYLKAWMMSPVHIAHPYPTEQEKAQIMADTGIELKQLTNWFVNNRKRYWKPRVEARLQQQAHAAAAAAQVHAAHAAVVAAATASARVNPVTPDNGFKPTLHLHPGNSFVSFDLGSIQSRENVSFPLVGADFTRFLNTNVMDASLRLVSEASSNGSVCSSGEEEASEPSHEEELAAPASEDEHDSSSVTPNDVRVSEEADEAASDVAPVEPVEKTTRKHTIHEVRSLPPRKRFKARSIEAWKNACQSAPSVHDVSLPTLEEASLLFGFSSKAC
jgi:hypothetical protein